MTLQRVKAWIRLGPGLGFLKLGWLRLPVRRTFKCINVLIGQPVRPTGFLTTMSIRQRSLSAMMG
eukprot:1348690-Amorphochlora_amoeboformis.AAC.4